MLVVKQSTARTVMVGPVLDASGVAVTDGVVADFKGSVNGAAPGALNGSATLTHRHTGHYSLALTATDLATLGSFEVTLDDTVNACAVKELIVIPAAIYDALAAGSEWLSVDPHKPEFAISGATLTVKKPDDTTTAYTKTLTTDPAAEPVVGSS